MTNNESNLKQSVKIISTKELGNLVREFRVAQKMTQADILG